MTKLIDWLAAVCAFLSIWLAVLYHFIELEIINEYRGLISLLPVLTVFLFGVSILRFVQYFDLLTCFHSCMCFDVSTAVFRWYRSMESIQFQ